MEHSQHKQSAANAPSRKGCKWVKYVCTRQVIFAPAFLFSVGSWHLLSLFMFESKVTSLAFCRLSYAGWCAGVLLSGTFCNWQTNISQFRIQVGLGARNATRTSSVGIGAKPHVGPTIGGELKHATSGILRHIGGTSWCVLMRDCTLSAHLI